MMNQKTPIFENAIKEIVPDGTLTVQHFQNGPQIDPLKRILTYEASEWETFIDEWVHSLEDMYSAVIRPTGPGDKGIDIAGYVDSKKLQGAWDNYQCKHYPVINFSDISGEIGKILWHSFNKVYVAPRSCKFIAPKGATTSLTLLLSHSDNLKKEIITKWDKSIAKKITSGNPILLESAFREYVESFDFSIFEAPQPRTIIEQHKATQYYIRRFGGGLPSRPKVAPPPSEISSNELSYTTKLFDAYGDHLKKNVGCAIDLRNNQPIKQHFDRSREAFYHAESLRVFVREETEPGTFESLQGEIFNGVIDTCDGNHKDGFECVKAVTDKAQSIALDAHPLNQSALPADKRGICHQLANNDRLTWKK